MIKVDIVGGSLSGLSAAITLRKLNKNINVIVHEKHKKIGYNHEGRRCGEGHSIGEDWKKWIPKGKSIFNVIQTVETIVGKKKYIAKNEHGTFFVLNRQEFIYQLGKEAEKLGAIIQTNDKVKSINDLDGKYIIDASGCPSSIKRELGLKKGITAPTYQQTLENCNIFNPHVCKVFLTDIAGYYWIFPRNPDKQEIKLGLGMIGNFNYNLKDSLEKFKVDQGIEGKVNHITGGLVPAGFQRPLKYNNILFVGDAGIGTFPLLGQGIYRALMSGDIAAECIAKGHPEVYIKRINEKFIKWEVLGKTFLRVNHIFNHVGKKSVFFLYHRYLDMWYSLH
jgi:flavin-dependent dehydrogenase